LEKTDKLKKNDDEIISEVTRREGWEKDAQCVENDWGYHEKNSHAPYLIER
jgi:hypothetical protein